jgi:hypothetical protein
LTGSEVLPKTSTKAIGIAEFLPSANRNMIIYRVNVINIDNITMGDLHIGKSGEFGPVVVTLFKSVTPLVFHVVGGSYFLAQETITSSDLQAHLYGKQISDLINSMKNGQVYVNIHTKQYPKGEIRGQIIIPTTTTMTTCGFLNNNLSSNFK